MLLVFSLGKRETLCCNLLMYFWAFDYFSDGQHMHRASHHQYKRSVIRSNPNL